MRTVGAAVNAFRQAACEVFRQSLETDDVTVAATSAGRGDRVSGDVLALIGFVGAVSGSTAICLHQGAARKFTTRMLGRDVLYNDSLIESAIGELGNMVTGRAAALAEAEGISFTPSPPTVVSGRDVLLSTDGALTVIVTRLQVLENDVVLYVGLRI